MGDGIIQFLLSLLLTKTLEGVREEMDEWNECLLGKYSYCTQDMVNLILYGKSLSYLHDGSLEVGGHVMMGLTTPVAIGQLSLFEYYENVTIGSFAKNPISPIFVVCSESHYTVLFAKDAQAYACFTPSSNTTLDLFYYDGLANQRQEIRLTLSYGRGKGMTEKRREDLIPPLELVISTKWGKDICVDWNDTDPLL
jgi:hypothetical protein